jgi:hypothetical protein
MYILTSTEQIKKIGGSQMVDNFWMKIYKSFKYIAQKKQSCFFQKKIQIFSKLMISSEKQKIYLKKLIFRNKHASPEELHLGKNKTSNYLFSLGRIWDKFKSALS